MKLQKTVIATAALATFAMGVSSQASASVYGGSQIFVDNFAIGFVNATTGSAITNLNPNYSFNVEDSATLNGATDAHAASCSSLLANCSAVSPVLPVAAANAAGGSVVRANTNYALYGQNTGTFANSNAEITTAQLVQGVPSSTKQVAEAELAGVGAGQASTNIQSNTTWTFSFSLADTANMVMSFSANPELFADVTLLPPNMAGLAQANLATDFTLRRVSGGGGSNPFVTWAPNGTNGDAICANVISCADIDPESLNETVGVGPGDSTASHSFGTGPSNFSLSIAGLTAGNYSLTLAGLTSVNVTQIPEPGTLALLGGALGVLGFGGLRRRKA